MNAKNTGKVSPSIISESLEKPMYLGLNGIPSETMPTDHTNFLFYNPTGYWSLFNSFSREALFNGYDSLHSKIVDKLWGSIQEYRGFSESLDWNTWRILFDSGRNPEVSVSKIDFSESIDTIRSHQNKNLIYKLLYTIDVYTLISNIVEVSKEVLYLAGDFYYILNVHSDFLGLPDESKIGIRTSKTPAANKLVGLMALIYIRLHSLLDYHTKLAYEIEKTRVDFEKYPKLSSKNELYSSRKKLKVNGSKDTLFEKDAFITEIDSYRNELIHNSLLDDEPRIYEKYEDRQLIERYLLLPDVDQNGRLESYINRRFFYSNERKFNYILPDLLRTFQERQLKTLNVLLQSMQL